ncbi:MAG: ATP-binding cassette domain-containing protein [Eubacteriaceae bacterium]
MIKIRDGRVSINSNIILSDINITIEDGKSYRITGKNGSGKTVLINSILQLEKNFIQKDSYTLPNNEVIYIPSSEFFTSDEKVKNVIKEILFLYEIDLDTCTNILKELNFYEDFNKFIGELSTGSIKKLLLVPLFVDRQYYFLDEILSGLDREIQVKVISRIRELIKKDNVTLIFVEHNNYIVNEILEKLKVGVILCEMKKASNLN